MPDQIIPAPFVKFVPTTEVPITQDPFEGHILNYNNQGKITFTPISSFREMIISGSKEATPTSSPTPWASGDPYLFEKYDVKTVGTYVNFKDASTPTPQPIEVTADDLNEKFVQIWVTNGVSKKEVTALPQATQNIPDFLDLQFPASAGTQSVYNDGLWQVRDGKVSTVSDIPGEDSIIWKRIGDKPKKVDTDLIFEKNSEDTGIKQVTADANASTSGVTNVHGISSPSGIVSNTFSSVKISFAQIIATPVTQIEIRLFQGKTAGGPAIVTKRQTITAASTVQTSATIDFDTPISYSGETWCQILMNAPFAYKKVSPAVRRTSSGGYGQTYITTVNDLDGTTFSGAQGYVDLYLEFNELVNFVETTEEGSSAILSAFTSSVTDDVTGDYLPANSYLNSSGGVVVSTNWRTSDLIPVTSGKVYSYKGSTSQSTAAVCMVGYNSSSVATVLIGNSDHYNTPLSIVIPDGIVNVRVCGYFATPPNLTITQPKIFPSLIPQNPADSKIKVNKTWNCVGHSIWWQDGIAYPSSSAIAVGIQTLVKRIFKFNSYNKYAYSGFSLGAQSLSDVNSIAATKFDTWTDASDSFWTIDTITNDFARNIPIGTITDYNNTTGILTYYGALRAFFNKIQSLTPNAPVICFNALRRDKDGYTSTSTNSAGYKLLDYEKAIMAIAALNGWRFVDQFRQSEITDETLDITTRDRLHPNDFGYRLCVKPVIENIWLYASEK